MTTIITPDKACVIKGYAPPLDDRPEPDDGNVIITLSSLDSAVRWGERSQKRTISYWRMFCEISMPNARVGFFRLIGGKVTLQNTGTHMIIAAPTLEQLLETFNEEVRRQ